MLKQAQAACEGLANCDWLPGDAMELSHLLGAPADYVLIANTFHGVPDQPALAREIAAVLKPAGRFAIINWYPKPREETPCWASRGGRAPNCACRRNRPARW